MPNGDSEAELAELQDELTSVQNELDDLRSLLEEARLIQEGQYSVGEDIATLHVSWGINLLCVRVKGRTGLWHQFYFDKNGKFDGTATAVDPPVPDD